MSMLSLLLLTACTTDGGIDSMVGQTQTDFSFPQVSGASGSKPNVSAPSGQAPAELQIKDIYVGDGKVVDSSSVLEFHYTLMAWSSGQVVESSWDSGQSATLALSQLIPGWQQGLPGMKEGGRRLLVIPPALGYGAQGSGSAIGPNETLIFVVDLLKAN